MSKPIGGEIWRYPYLWRWQYETGETEGRKKRPAAFVAVLKGKDGATNLFVLAITSVAPSSGRDAIAVPEIERRRAGLDNIPLWVVVDEYNHDVLETSAYFEPDERVGAFSGNFHKKVLAAFAASMRHGKASSILRVD